MFVYGQSFYVKDELKTHASRYLAALPTDVTCLVSTGSSGCSIAAAMLTLSTRRLRHWYIRKEGERGHSGAHTNGAHGHRGELCIVDDFISSGDTIKRVILVLSVHGIKAKYILVDHDDSSRGTFDDGPQVIITRDFRSITFTPVPEWKPPC